MRNPCSIGDACLIRDDFLKRSSPAGLYLAMRSTIGVLALVVSAAAPACIDEWEDTGDPSELGETAQAVTWTKSTSYLSCTAGPGGTNSCDFDLGTPADGHHVCLIDGVQGPIQGSGTYHGSAIYGITATISAPGGRFWLHLNTGPWDPKKPDPNRTVGASTICFAADVTAHGSWQMNKAPVSPAPTILTSEADSANTMCFLSGLYVGFNGFTGPATANVFVNKDSFGRWQVGGYQAGGSEVTAYAQCVKAPGPARWFYHHDSTGLQILPLAPNTEPNPNSVCGLNRIQGEFKTSADQLGISYSSLFTRWQMNMNGGNHVGDSYCFN